MSTKQANLVERLNRVVRLAARAVVPAFKYAPNAAVVQAAGLQPAEVWLENNVRRAAVRLRSLDPGYPLVARAAEPAPRGIGRGVRTSSEAYLAARQ